MGLRAHLAPPLRRFSAATQAQDAELSALVLLWALLLFVLLLLLLLLRLLLLAAAVAVAAAVCVRSDR